ncbi:D-alanyl-D-alanine carboxypeptidase family protein [Candidatus Peregrinibacteria bacterium]|nr:D-alanyl-D-alanine carboxypeptidase family protein [Candidatus Peregrinibacteria bacterium]
MTGHPELQKDPERNNYYRKIESDYIRRDQRTSALVKKLTGLEAERVVNMACKAAGINELNDSLTAKVLLLQDRICNFELRDKYDACDGILGPVTLRALKQKLPSEFRDFLEKRKDAHIASTKKRLTQIRPGLPSATETLTPKDQDRKTEEQKKTQVPASHEATHINELSPNFNTAYNQIGDIRDPEKLIRLKNQIVLSPNDRLITLPDEKSIKLRSGAALRYKCFKQYCKIKGYEIRISSGYRSAERQMRIWQNALKKYGSATEAQKWAARPGKSHHNTGGAIDIYIAKTPDGVKMPMYKFRGSKAMMYRALNDDNYYNSLPLHMQKAVSRRLFLDQNLMASHFLGQNYTKENWHWNIDRDENGRDVYQNV